MIKETYKIVLFGASCVGKSTLTVKLVEDIFIEKYNPTMEDLYRNNIMLDGAEYYLEITDTSGSDLFSGMRDFYIKSNDGFILVYSITSISSFMEVEDFYKLIMDIKDNHIKIPCLIAGNKSDLNSERTVAKDMVTNFTEKHDLDHIETCAKDLISVQNMFINIINQIKIYHKNLFTSKTKKKEKNVLFFNLIIF